MASSVFPPPRPGMFTQVDTVQVVRRVHKPVTYAGAALSGAIGTGLLGALIGGLLPGVSVATGAKYGAALGVLGGMINVYTGRVK